MNKEFTLGILGGMGPLAGVEFQRRIIEKTPARSDQDHITMVCFTNPKIHDRTESIRSGQDFSEEIVDSLTQMSAMQIDMGVIACNTAHAEFGKIAMRVDFPLLNLVEETVVFIKNKLGLKRVGLLATDGTLVSKVYQKSLERNDLELVTPQIKDQAVLMEVIYGASGIKAGTIDQKNIWIVEQLAVNLLSQGAEVVILGCTEISVLKINGTKMVDPIDVVAQKVVELALAMRKY